MIYKIQSSIPTFLNEFANFFTKTEMETMLTGFPQGLSNILMASNE